MKVKIGKYVNWIGPYQIAEMLCFWAPKVKEDIGIHRNPEWVHNFGTWLAEDKEGNPSYLSKICEWIHEKRKRKIEIHLDRWDTWSMDHTLALIIVPMLKQLKASKHGSPISEDIDVPEHLRSTEEPNEENGWLDNTYEQRWDWIMDEMIWTFEQLVDDDNDAQFHTGVPETLMVPFDENHNPIGEPRKLGAKDPEGIKAVYYRMIEGPNSTSVFDAEGYEAHHKRISNGLRLFGKYYRALWD